MLLRSRDSAAGDECLDAAQAIYRRLDAGHPWFQRVAAIRRAARPDGEPRSERALAKGWSQREIEVLRLVAAGYSNHQIADDLAISVRTVERHLSHMYNKLGASGKPARAVAAAYGIASGLVDQSRVAGTTHLP